MSQQSRETLSKRYSFRGSLVLYSTDHCQLCEQCLDLLLSMPELSGLTLQVVDVADSEELTLQYGAELPVLSIGDEQLRWPFDGQQVRASLRRQFAHGEAIPE